MWLTVFEDIWQHQYVAAKDRATPMRHQRLMTKLDQNLRILERMQGGADAQPHAKRDPLLCLRLLVAVVDKTADTVIEAAAEMNAVVFTVCRNINELFNHVINPVYDSPFMTYEDMVVCVCGIEHRTGQEKSNKTGEAEVWMRRGHGVLFSKTLNL